MRSSCQALAHTQTTWKKYTPRLEIIFRTEFNSLKAQQRTGRIYSLNVKLTQINQSTPLLFKRPLHLTSTQKKKAHIPKFKTLSTSFTYPHDTSTYSAATSPPSARTTHKSSNSQRRRRPRPALRHRKAGKPSCLHTAASRKARHGPCVRAWRTRDTRCVGGRRADTGRRWRRILRCTSFFGE